MNSYKFFETHCHLDSLKAATIDETIKNAKSVNVDKILTIAVNPENLQTVNDLSIKYPDVYATQGIHPHDAKSFKDEHLDEIKKRIASNKKIVAIGEIGLDYHYDFSPKETQLEVFEKQLQLSIDLDLPVVIHSRESDEDMIRLLIKYAPKINSKGVLHSFSSSLELAKIAIDLGFYLAFNGIATFKMAENVRDAIRITPTDRILFETDSPYLAPTPHRGKENSPTFIPLIAKKIFEVKNEPDETIFYDIVYKNSLKLFKI